MSARPQEPAGPPVLRRDNFPAVRAWNFLRKFRQHQIAPDGIREPLRFTFDDISKYATRFGPHDDDGFALFLAQMGVMEDVFMAVTMEQISNQRRMRRSGG